MRGVTEQAGSCRSEAAPGPAVPAHRSLPSGLLSSRRDGPALDGSVAPGQPRLAPDGPPAVPPLGSAPQNLLFLRDQPGTSLATSLSVQKGAVAPASRDAACSHLLLVLSVTFPEGHRLP